MENIRKTLAYKIGGYIGLILLILILLILPGAVNIVISGNGWDILAIIVILCAAVGYLPIVILPIFIILTTIAIKTRKNYINKKTQIVADIGYIMLCIITFIFILLLPITIDFFTHNLKIW